MQRLSLSSLEITGEGFYELRRLPLREMRVRDTKLSSAGLHTLQWFRSLETLELSNTPLNDDSLHAVARLPRLRDLIIDGAKVVSLNALTRSRYHGNESLSFLSLSRSTVDDSFIDGLSDMPDLFPAMQMLAIDHTRITKKGLRALLNQVGEVMPLLNTIVVSDDQIDDELQADWMTALPNVEIQVRK